MKSQHNENLFTAVRRLDIDQARSLVNNDSINARDEDDKQRTPLHIAAAQIAKGSSDMVTFLLESNAEVNSEDSLKMTPLYLSLMVLSSRIAEIEDLRIEALNVSKLLLDAKADINIISRTKKTPLQLIEALSTTEHKEYQELLNKVQAEPVVALGELSFEDASS